MLAWNETTVGWNLRPTATMMMAAQSTIGGEAKTVTSELSTLDRTTLQNFIQNGRIEGVVTFPLTPLQHSGPLGIFSDDPTIRSSPSNQI